MKAAQKRKNYGLLTFLWSQIYSACFIFFLYVYVQFIILSTLNNHYKNSWKNLKFYTTGNSCTVTLYGLLGAIFSEFPFYQSSDDQAVLFFEFLPHLDFFQVLLLTNLDYRALLLTDGNKKRFQEIQS